MHNKKTIFANQYSMWILGLLLLIGLGGTFWNNYYQHKDVSNQIALDDASNFIHSVSQFRNFYTASILPRLRERGLTITHDYHNIPNSVPLPATFTTDFGEYMSAESLSYKVRLFSDLPFAWRETGGIKDDFEAHAITQLRANPSEPVWRFEEDKGQTILRYAIADVLTESCVSCHNSYPGTPKNDWKIGDVRGVLEVARPISGLNKTLEQSAQKTFAIMVSMAVMALLFISLILHRLRKALQESQRLVNEKTQINQKLNHEIELKDALTKDLHLATDQALESSKMKTEFLANMSHEFRTPMNGIIGMSELLKETPLNTQQADWLSTISASANSLLKLLNDILDFSKIESGKLNLTLKPFELKPLLMSVIKSLEPSATEKGLSLDMQVADNLPDWILSDEMRIRQILLNLIDNAIKFTHRGSIQIQVMLDNENPQQLKITVQDTGVGIPEFAKEKLFKAFSQVDGSTTRLYGGTGLGLSMTQKLVYLLGGTIGFDSQEGSGSRFWFTLKLTKALNSTQTEPRPDGIIHILLVEDNPVNTKIALALLKKLNYSADTAENGAIALEKLATGNYDLVLMDCQMPVKDGYQTTEELRLWDNVISKTPVIAITANALPDDEEKCYRSGMDDYISKPINPKVLAEKLTFWHAHINAQKP